MKKTKLILSAGVAAGALLGLALTMPESPKLNPGGEKRIAAYLSTDKMIYRPGETIYFRIVALDAFIISPCGKIMRRHSKSKDRAEMW
ncbi:MAG: hypothetical protein V8T87_09705 [Victivallales bacterium]